MASTLQIITVHKTHNNKRVTTNNIQLLCETLPKIWSKNSMSNDEVQFLEVWHEPIIQENIATAGIAISAIAKLRWYLTTSKWEFNQQVSEYLTWLDSFYVHVNVLGHTPTPFLSVESCHLHLFPGKSHSSQVFLDHASPVCPWPAGSPLETWDFPV